MRVIIRTAAQTVEVESNEQTEVSDWRLRFRDRIGNDIRIFVSDELIEEMMEQIKEQRGAVENGGE